MKDAYLAIKPRQSGKSHMQDAFGYAFGELKEDNVSSAVKKGNSFGREGYYNFDKPKGKLYQINNLQKSTLKKACDYLDVIFSEGVVDEEIADEAYSKYLEIKKELNARN